MRRSVVLAAIVLVISAGAIAFALGASRSPAPPETAGITGSGATSASPSPLSVLNDRFGFVVRSHEATVRSETSDALVSSFAPKERSFTFLSRTVSPDGRLVAYWDPVDRAPVLRVRSVAGGDARPALTGRPGMNGNAFTWSSDGTGLVAAIDNGCQEICDGVPVAELWTVDLASGATEKIASGSIWAPVAWDRAAMLVGAGVTGPGGYVTGYDVVDLRQQPYTIHSTAFRPTVAGRLKASGDAHYVLLSAAVDGTSTSLAWWPVAEPERRSTTVFDGQSAEWRPGTNEIWWVGGLEPLGCRTELCAGTRLVSLDVTTGSSKVVPGRFGSLLEGFRIDGTAAIIAASGSVRTELTLVELATGRTTAVSLGGSLEGTVRLR